MVDLYSRFLFLRPLKDKTAAAVRAALDAIIEENELFKIRTIATDAGKEFVANIPYYRDKGIKWFILKGKVKASLAENQVKIFKNLLYKVIRKNKGVPWTKVYDDVLMQLNSRPLKKLGEKSPQSVLSPFEDVTSKPVLKKNFGEKPKNIKDNRFKVGDLVFLELPKHVNDKSYDIQRGVIKKVKDVKKDNLPHVYILENFDGTELSRNFYAEELRKAPGVRKLKYEVEKIYKARRKNKRKEYQVAFYNSP